MDRRPTETSNRQTPADEEARGEPTREEAGTAEPQVEVSGPGAFEMTALPNRHTSHKVGTRAIAQKESHTRYADRSMPATRKKPGAFGKEPRYVAAEDSTSEDDYDEE